MSPEPPVFPDGIYQGNQVPESPCPTCPCVEERLHEAKRLREQARMYFNAGALKLKQAKHMRKEAENTTAAARKFEKAYARKNDCNKKAVAQERKASINARAALRKQRNKNLI